MEFRTKLYCIYTDVLGVFSTFVIFDDDIQLAMCARTCEISALLVNVKYCSDYPHGLMSDIIGDTRDYCHLLSEIGEFAITFDNRSYYVSKDIDSLFELFGEGDASWFDLPQPHWVMR